MVKSFASRYREVGKVVMPPFTGLRIMMMPVVIGEFGSLPECLSPWEGVLGVMFADSDIYTSQVGYLTIDEKVVGTGGTHRRAGLHVDGVYRGKGGKWGGRGAPWSNIDSGMLTVSRPAGCRVFSGVFMGEPRDEGECDHLRDQCGEGKVLEDSTVYWMYGLCVHESLEQKESVKRQFVRLSLPSEAPWFEGYTVNPLGVLPTGEILPRRAFMDI